MEKSKLTPGSSSGRSSHPSAEAFRKVKWIKRKRGILVFLIFLCIVGFVLFFDYYWVLISRLSQQPSRVAEKAAGKTAGLSETERRAALELTGNLIEKGRVEEARQAILSYLQRESSAEGNYLAGLVYMRQGDVQSAYRYLKEAIRLNPSLYQARQKLAEIYLTIGDLKSAHESAAILLKQDSFREDGLVLQSEIDLEEGKLDEALKKLERFEEKRGTVSENNLIRLAGLYARKGEFQKAAQIIGKIDENGLNSTGLLMLSRYYLNRGEKAKSAEIMESALKRYPEVPEVQFFYGQQLFNNGKYREAVPYFGRVYQIMPQSRIASYRYGQSLIASRQLDRAKRHIDDTLSKFPNDILAMSLKFRYELLNQERGEAIKTLKQTITLVPEAPRPHTLLAELYWAEGILTVSEVYAQRAIKLGEPSISPWIVLGDIYFRKGQYFKGIEQYRKVLEREPNNLVALAQSAEGYLNLNEVKKAEPLYEKILLLYPDMAVIRAKLEMVRNFQKGPREILAIAHRQFQRAPEDFQAVSGYIRALILNGRYDDAAGVLRREISKNPKNVQYSIMLGDLFLLQRNLPAAKKAFDEAVQAAPKDMNLLINIGSRYERYSLDKEAEAIYLTLSKLYPENIVALNHLAWYYTDSKGDFEKAKPFIEVLRVRGEGAYEKDTVGWFFFKTGDYSSAESFFRDALQMDPDNNVIRGHLALALFRSGKSRDALAEARKVIPVLPAGNLREDLSRLLPTEKGDKR